MNNLYLLIGEDKSRVNFELNEIINKINSDNHITYDLTEATLTDILDEASMISLFGDTKIIIGTNFDLSKITKTEEEYLTKYIANKNKDNYIILIAKSIDARKAIYKPFKENFEIIDTTKTDDTNNLFNYIKNESIKKQFKMTDSTIEYLLARANNNFSDIKNELTKLFIYKEKEKEITIIDIDLLVPENIDSVIYEFTNAFLESDLDTVVKMYHNFKIQNISFDYLVTSLANTLRQALIIKILKEDKLTNAEIAKEIGKKEFYVKKMLERIYQYSKEDLGSYITRLSEIDNNYKSGKSNIDELELFLINKNS